MIKVPKDNDDIRKEYEDGGMGTCGPAVIAVLTRSKVSDIISLWPVYNGYALLTEMRYMLKKLRFNHKLHNGYKSTTFPVLKGKYILRIQWQGKTGGQYRGYDSWHEAACNTHYVLVDNDKVFCNEMGIFKIDMFRKYLADGDGYITSYLEVWK